MPSQSAPSIKASKQLDRLLSAEGNPICRHFHFAKAIPAAYPASTFRIDGRKFSQD